LRPSLRFLCVALLGWAGIRSATLGVLPGAALFEIGRSEAKAPPPIVPTQLPPIEPLAHATADAAPMAFTEAALPYGPTPASRPAYVPRPLTKLMPEPRPAFYAPIPALDDWPLSRIASTAHSPLSSTVVAAAQSIPATWRQQRIDRVQVTAWALLRGQQGGIAGPDSLASGGTLGGSQAGARIAYNFTRQIAATLRTTSEVGRRGGEVAAGIRVQPVASIPVWLTAERRQRLGKDGGGRNDFALFLEGGVYQRPMPWRFALDAYLQGGVVGVRRRDLFVDGAVTLTRPVFKQFSAGFGLWGGAQPGVYRVDAGPRVSMRVRNNLKLHVDWRQRIAGKAAPGSGPALTVAGDF
jgi:hypothetical protein